jgi:hypothetical protein
MSRLAFFAVVLLALGCGGSGAGGDAGHQGAGGTNGGAGGTNGGGASGGVGGRSAIDPTPFLGAWTDAQTIALSGTCAGVGQSVTQTEQITVSTGTSSDLIVSLSGGACSLPFTITSSSQATLAGATPCMLSVTGVGTVTATFNTSTITISGNNGTEVASGTVFGPSCPFNLTGTLTR